MMTAFSSLALLHAGSFDWRVWKLYPSFMIGWLLFGAAYFLCIGPLRRRFAGSRPASTRQVACFSAALLASPSTVRGRRLGHALAWGHACSTPEPPWKFQAADGNGNLTRRRSEPPRAPCVSAP